MAKTEIKPNQCRQIVMTDGGWHSRQCTRTKNLVERDGKLYCKQHDPVEVKRRRDERDAKWDADWKARREAAEKDQLIRVTHPKLVELARMTWAWVEPQLFTPEHRKRYFQLIEDLKADGLDVTKEPEP